MYDPFRTLWAIVAIAGAVLVGVSTHDAGFTALTFLGALVLPRVLGFRRHRHVGPMGWHGHGGPHGHCGPREQTTTGETATA